MPVMPSTHDETPGQSHDHDALRGVTSNNLSDDELRALIETQPMAPLDRVPAEIIRDLARLVLREREKLRQERLGSLRDGATTLKVAAREIGRAQKAEADRDQARAALARVEAHLAEHGEFVTAAGIRAAIAGDRSPAVEVDR